jgi:hypothetical protein
MSNYGIAPTLMAATEYLHKKQKAMEKSCIWNIKPVIKERKLPKTWEEFCEMFPIKTGECYINDGSDLRKIKNKQIFRFSASDRNVLPDSATAEAVLALCQLIQLRNCYNGDWAPNWTDDYYKFMIEFKGGEIYCSVCIHLSLSPLYFKTAELRDEFLRNFRPLVEKLKPLYGII